MVAALHIYYRTVLRLVLSSRVGAKVLFVVVYYTILLVGWLVPWLHRARVGSYDVVRLSGQDTTLAKDKFSSHLLPTLLLHIQIISSANMT